MTVFGLFSARDFSLSPPVRAGQTGLGRALHRMIESAEKSGAIEQAADRLHSVVAPALDDRRLRELLHGAWLGHAAHPFFTDFAEGAWMAASFLDIFGPEGSEAPAQRLLGFGLLAAVPTALTGLADWTRTEGPARQSGLVHAGTSSVATLLYAASYVARRIDKGGPAVMLGLAGGIMATLDGWIGGHLSLSRAVGVENSP